jgi:hypothetical protein
MAQGREEWTDPRIDDLRDGVKDLGGRMDAGFARVDEKFARVDARFEKVDEALRLVNARMDAGFARSDERFDALQRTLMLTGGGIIAALIALIGTQL